MIVVDAREECSRSADPGGLPPPGRSNRASGAALGDVLIGANHDDSAYACGVCRVTAARGHRVVGLPYGHRHGIHVRCVVGAIRTGGPQARPLCGTCGRISCHGRRETQWAAVQADLELRVAATGFGGTSDNSGDG